jgi:hypothetical protein
MGMRSRVGSVVFLEYASIQLSLAESRFAGRYEERDASRSSNEKSYIATIKHQTIGVGMHGRVSSFVF